MIRSVWMLMVALLTLLAPSAPAAATANPSLSEAERGIRRGGDAPAVHLRIETMKVEARVTGRVADVTLELLIASDAAEPYEANLGLDMPADAVVTGYALDVGGVLIPGLLLERPRARNLYEDEVRKGIDPGLAEVSAANRFTTRIFPVTRAMPRRFRLSFSAPFDPARGLVLPLMRDEVVGSVELAVVAQGYAAPPAVRFLGKAEDLVQARQGWTANTIQARGALLDGLAIVGGQPAAPALRARHDSGESFFLIGDGAARAADVRAKGGRLRLYWDRSLSRRTARIEAEIEALARLVETTRPSAIDLVTFASDRPRVTSVAGMAELRAALGRVAYRGGTSFAGLDALALERADRCVMVSDGQATIDRAAAFAPDCALDLLSSGGNDTRAGRLAQRSGGRLVRLGDGEGAAAAAAASLARASLGVVAVRDGNGKRLDYRALPAGPDQWLLAGPAPSGDEVRVQLSDGSSRSYRLGPDVQANAPGALWASQKVADLSDDPARHAEMAALARRFSVAGPEMSFLVLERPDQYLEAELTPPAGFPKTWVEQYRGEKARYEAARSEARGERLAYVVKAWAERKQWWAKRYTPRGRVKTRRGDDDASESISVTAQAPPPPPVVAPPPPAPEPMTRAERAGFADAAGEIVVTGSAMRRPSLEAASPITVVGAERVRRAPGTSVALDLENLLGDRPYLAALAAARPGERLAVLGAQERAHGEVAAFYLDTAEWFRLKGDSETAALLLLSALELPTSDDETAQIVAFRLERDGSFDRAVELAERLAAANAEFRPQPARSLALALQARGKARGARGRADLERAFTLLTEAALNPASRDFDGFEVVALMDANALIQHIEAAGGQWRLDPRLVALLDADARIVIEWTADDADIDLWVDEPNGEKVYYSQPLSSAGGTITNDMTNGYGPEEYAIRRAPPGAYRVRINGYDADRINPNGPGHVLIRLIRHHARPAEQGELIDADLSFQAGANRDDSDGAKPVATLRVGGPRE